MLKTLRITSIVAVIVALCVAITLVFMGLKENPKVKDLLDSPGIADRFKNRISGQDGEEAKISPLVAQAKAFALRIDPPPPPKPVVKNVPKQPSEAVKRTPPKPVIPAPKVAATVKGDLLATVVYEAAPEKSLALLTTTGGKEEWFRQGDKVGHLEIKEIRNGSVIFTQGGKNPREKFVPQETPIKSILKNDQTVSSVPVSGSGSTAIPKPVSHGSESTSGTASMRMVRPIDRTAPRSGTDISKRIRRVRSMPKQPSPQEQKETLERTIAGMKKIMSADDPTVPKEERQKAKEMFSVLLAQLKKDAAELEKKKKDAETSAAAAGNPAASDPNKPKNRSHPAFRTKQR